MNEKILGVSVIICCYNSAKRLPETLKHLALQEIPAIIPWEVIIVNNVSKDDTSNLAVREWQKYNLSHVSFKVVDELTPGLSFARAKGVIEAKYEYIIFCDDDNWLKKDYIKIAYDIISANEKIGALGGQSVGQTDGNFPSWFENIKEAYAVGKQSEKTGDISNRKYLWGSGLTIRKSLFNEAFFQQPSLLTDRKGKSIAAGGDSEICMRFLLMNYNLFYDERLFFTHYIPHDRLTIDYKKSLFDGVVLSRKILTIYEQQIIIKNMRVSEKTESILKVILKYILSRLKLSNKYDLKSLRIGILLMTGMKLQEVDASALFIRKFYLGSKRNS
ncbi:MAG: glycosyltransferase [Sphingobacteriaceae bacterium]